MAPLADAAVWSVRDNGRCSPADSMMPNERKHKTRPSRASRARLVPHCSSSSTSLPWLHSTMMSPSGSGTRGTSAITAVAIGGWGVARDDITAHYGQLCRRSHCAVPSCRAAATSGLWGPGRPWRWHQLDMAYQARSSDPMTIKLLDF